MRTIGQLDGEANARRFGDYLTVQGIENQVEAEKGGAWSVWIHSDEELERATALLEAFRANPADAKFQAAGKVAQALREKKQKDLAAFEKRVRKHGRVFRPVTGYRAGPLTFLLICVSTVVFIATRFGNHLEAASALFITHWITDGESVRWMGGLPEIRHGEVWRLITPIFVHGDALHIVFNMWWLFDLGSMVESRQSSGLYAVLVLVFAAGSNLAQYLWSGPLFFGMSGVVYGLIGYIWIRGKFDPGSGLFLHPQVLVPAIIWFFLGWTGLMHMANMCHAGGLVIGMAWGYLSSLRHR
jgi:GlpG protein